MTTLVRRPSGGPLQDMLDWVERDWITGRKTWGLVPNIRIEDYVDDDVYVVRAEMPGVDPDKDVTLTVKDGALTIRAERREEKQDKNFHEFEYGSFARRIPLPAGAKADDVTATYVDGMLEVRVPIAVTTVEERPIPIQRNGDAG